MRRKAREGRGGKEQVAIVRGKPHGGRREQVPILLPKGSISVVLFKYTESRVNLGGKKSSFFISGLQTTFFSPCTLHKARNPPEAGVHSTLCTLANPKAWDFVSPGLV